MHAVFRLADHDHLLLFKLVDAVYAALLDAVSADLLAKAGGVAGQGLGQFFLGQDGIDKLADHAVLAGTDQVEILSLDLVHHVFHLGKAHHAGHYFASDHEGGDIIGKAPVDHKIARVAENGRMQPGDIALQVVKAVAAGLAGGIQLNARQALHDVHMVGDLKIGGHRLAKALDLHILRVAAADWHARVNDLGDLKHLFTDLFGVPGFIDFQLRQLLLHVLDLLLDFFGLLLFAALHHAADLLGEAVALSAQEIGPLDRLTVEPVQLGDFIHQRELVILELLFDVFLHQIRVVAYQVDIDHEKNLLKK